MAFVSPYHTSIHLKTINKHEVCYLCPHWRLSAKANQWVCDLGLFSRAIVNQMILFAFQLTDSLFNMSDHLLHATRLISISASSKEEHEQSNPSIHSPSVPAVFCLTRSNGTKTSQDGSAVYRRRTQIHSRIHTSEKVNLTRASLDCRRLLHPEEKPCDVKSSLFVQHNITWDISVGITDSQQHQLLTWALWSKGEASSKKLLKNEKGNLWRHIQREVPILLSWWRCTGLKPDVQLKGSGNIRTLTWTPLFSPYSNNYERIK